MKAIACTLGMMLVATTWSTPAAALELTLDDVASAGNPFVATVETSGYRFSGPSLRTIDTPGSTYVSNGSAVYLAQTVAGPVGGVTLQRIDGMPFDLYEFAAAGLFAAVGGSPNSTHVSVLAIQVGGAGLSAIYDLGAAAGFVHLPVPTSWNNLEFVTFGGVFSAAAAGALALDDIGVGSGPVVPEPAALVLALTTLAGLGVLALSRRS
ncbi:MAG: hypothetical protein ACHQ8D_21715 [Candidatus Rokuibacteriota bacterium]